MPTKNSASDLPASDLPEDLALANLSVTELKKSSTGLVPPTLQLPSVMLDSISDAFLAVDSEFRYVWVNAEAERLLGMKREQFFGHTVWELFPQVAGSEFETRARQVLLDRAPQEFEHFYEHQGVWARHKIFSTDAGGLAIYWHDITEQKRLAADLRRQALVLAQIHDPLITADLKGQIATWNKGAERIFGYSASEAIGQPISLLFFEADQNWIEPSVCGPLRREGHAEVELRQRRKSGDACIIRASLSLLHDESNQPYGILGVCVDVTAQRQAETALRESEERYRCLAQALPQPASMTDANGQPLFINQYWQQYAGISLAQQAEVDWLGFVHPEEITPLRARWAGCLESGDNFEAECRLRNAEGEYRWHLTRAVAVRGPAGDVRQWVATATDIHEHKCAAQAQALEEERFRLAAKALGGFVYDWLPATGMVHRNGDLEHILGVGPQEAEPLDSWWQERIHPDDQAKSSLSLLRNLSRDQTNFTTEFRIRHASGHWLHLCDQGYVVRDADGKPVRVVGATQDITARKNLEAEVQAHKAILEFQSLILATTNDAVVAIDPDRVITYMSSGAERLYGVPSSEAMGKPLSSLHGYAWLEPEDEKRCWSDLAERGSWMGDYIHIRKDGTRIIVSSTVNMLPEASGGGMVAVIRDVSERRHAELEVRRQATQLARANEDLTHFAFVVSHDLQAPLRTVISFSQLLAMKYKTRLDEQGSEFVRLIVEAGSRMSAMIRDLLELARCAGDEQSLQPCFPLSEALSAALDSLRSEIHSSNAEIKTGDLPVVSADLGQMAQVFQNLIGNSLKYRKPDCSPVIEITAERAGNEWVLKVRDNGIGFEPEHAEQVFGVFKRLHGNQYSGTGVGLAICKRIVERRGGRIWATAEPGVGASFCFSLPDEFSMSRVAIESNRQPATESIKPPVLTVDSAVAPFEELFQTLDLAHAVVRDMEGKILIWTQGAERLFGWSKQEAAGQHLHTLLQTGLPASFQEVETELYTRDEWKGQISRRRKDGSVIWLATHWSLYRDGSGRGQSVIEVDNDITALKEAEHALKQSGAQRDIALRAGRMGVWRWDKLAGVVDWDETIEHLHGMPSGTFEKTFDAYRKSVHPDDWPYVAGLIEDALEHGPEYSAEFRAVRIDGTVMWLATRGQVIREQSQVTGMIGVVWDISQRKQEELDRKFLSDLAVKLSPPADPRAISAAAVTSLGEHTGALHCSYCEIDLSTNQFSVLSSYPAGDVTAERTYNLAGFGDVAPDLTAGQVVAVGDSETDPRTTRFHNKLYAPAGICSVLIVPLHREGLWRASLSVTNSKKRTWTERDITLLRLVADRLWYALQNASASLD